MDRTNRRGTRPGQLLDHAPPHDVDAERAVLAVLLLEPGRIAAVAAALEPADFGNQVNRTIYEAVLRLQAAGRPEWGIAIGSRVSKSTTPLQALVAPA